MQIIDIHNLIKTYNGKGGRVTAVDNLTISVEEGEIFGLIGADGAGKTTVFRVLTSLLLPDSGIAKVMGADVVREYKQVRKFIGYMPGKFSLYQDLTVEENIRFFATLFGAKISENYYLIKGIYDQIAPFKDRLAGKLSGGMKQKLALCCALIHKPSLLFLDEPTTGIDPLSRVSLWDMLYELKKEGITILVSTPYMDEAMRCDRVALMNQGVVLDVDSPKNIASKSALPVIEVKTNQKYLLLTFLRSLDTVRNAYAFGESIHVVSDLGSFGLRRLIEEAGIGLMDMREIRPSIEDCFIEYCQESSNKEYLV